MEGEKEAASPTAAEKVSHRSILQITTGRDHRALSQIRERRGRKIRNAQAADNRSNLRRRRRVLALHGGCNLFYESNPRRKLR